MKVGLKFEFAQVKDRVQGHLIKNIDRVRKDRAKGGGGDGGKGKEWKPARTLDWWGRERVGEATLILVYLVYFYCVCSKDCMIYSDMQNIIIILHVLS